MGTLPAEPYVATGETFGRLTALESAQDSRARILWRCKCGTEKTVVARIVKRGRSQSCGCLQRERAVARFAEYRRTTGWSRHPLYPTWHAMMDRTTRESHHNYRFYGARGIRVCERWQDARTFYADIDAEIGPRPPGRTLDRIDNDRNYEPGNVRWATPREQRVNQRKRTRIADLEARLAQAEARVRELETVLASHGVIVA